MYTWLITCADLHKHNYFNLTINYKSTHKQGRECVSTHSHGWMIGSLSKSTLIIGPCMVISKCSFIPTSNLYTLANSPQVDLLKNVFPLQFTREQWKRNPCFVLSFGLALVFWTEKTPNFLRTCFLVKHWMNCGGEQYLALYAVKNALSKNKQDRYGRSEYENLGI